MGRFETFEALHVPGNGNPTGVDVKSKTDTVPFHPYYTVKDGFAIVVFLILAALGGVLAAIPPARRASRLDVLEALAYE